MSGALFQHSVRISPKAKSVRLRVSVQKGLEVIVPREYEVTRIPDLLERKRHWIRSALDRADENRRFFRSPQVWQLPATVTLRAIGRTWCVEPHPADLPWVAVQEVGDTLEIRGKVTDEISSRAALQRWLSRKAHQYLVPMLKEVSRKTGRPFGRAYVKHQRTRWASCSRHKSISLNAKLLFLDPDLVRYVMIHELCHTQEMHHSRRFWLIIQSACPNFRTLDIKLRDAWKMVPRWLQQDGSDGNK